jgi:hypothetical protein
VLKKAGIIVAASAAGILAFTPLAFAGSKGDDNGSHHSKDDKSNSKSHKDDDGGDHKDDGGDTSKDNVSNDCEFGNEGGSPVANATGGNSLLGAVGLVSSLATDATSQLNTLNCNNINVTDLVDTDSNNDTTTRDQTRVEDSFNTEG